jgi:ribosome biogenesis GTPase / thiamine phosphate phosphatase
MTSVYPSLLNLGWNDTWLYALERAPYRGQPGRVTRAGRLLMVQTESGAVLAECPADIPERPVCGDWVIVELHGGNCEQELRGRIRCTLQRRNAIERHAVGAERPQAIVANVDDIWLVCGLDRSQGIRSLTRYQALCRLDNVVVTVVLNKVDTTNDLERCVAQARSKALDLEIVTVSALTHDGLEQLESKLQKYHTLALLGPSGVGKSTLINGMTADDEQRTHTVRAGDHRGCHTTSAGQLLTTRSGALIIDTPGLRELGLWQTAGLDNTYADILELAQSCRFRDCTHTHEPGCYVQLAVEQELLASERFTEYLELFRERETRAKLVKGKKRRYG